MLKDKGFLWKQRLNPPFDRQGIFGAGETLPGHLFPFGLGITLPFSPRSTPALDNAFTTAVMVPLCPRTSAPKVLCSAANG